LFNVEELEREFHIRPITSTKAEVEDMKTLLEHPLSASLFKQHCIEHNSVENFAFLIAVNAVEKIPKESEARKDALQLIVDDFLRPVSRFELNISSDCKKKLLEKAEEGPLDTYDLIVAIAEIQDLLRLNSYRTFTKSSDYITAKKWMRQFAIQELPEFKEDLVDGFGSATGESLQNQLSTAEKSSRTSKTK
jgi:hypothetical protein